ncbi:J domain-containing protein [Nocardia gipuzkoensis]
MGQGLTDLIDRLGGDSAYEILGLAQTACYDEIRAKWRRLGARWHPDRWPADRFSPSEISHAEAMFLKVAAAWEVLAKHRAEYDQYLTPRDPWDTEPVDESGVGPEETLGQQGPSTMTANQQNSQHHNIQPNTRPNSFALVDTLAPHSSQRQWIDPTRWMWEYPQPGPTWQIAKRSSSGGCLSAVLAFVVLMFALIVIGAVQFDNSDHYSGESNNTTTRSYADRSPYPATSHRTLGPTEYTYPTKYTTTQPLPRVAAGDCIAVTASGYLLRVVDCYSGSGAYRVDAVRYLSDRYDECPDPGSPSILENGYRICASCRGIIAIVFPDAIHGPPTYGSPQSPAHPEPSSTAEPQTALGAAGMQGGSFSTRRLRTVSKKSTIDNPLPSPFHPCAAL